MTTDTRQDNALFTVSTATAIHVVGDPSVEWVQPNLFKQTILFKASAILALASFLSGILTILLSKHLISVEEKDFLVGICFMFSLGGALWLSGNLNKKRAALLLTAVIVFQTWNTLFFKNPPLGFLVLVWELWLPIYWSRTDEKMMTEFGLSKRGLPLNFLIGLIVSAAIACHIGWGMKNYGFSIHIDLWDIIVNSAQVFPMYIAVFCLFHFVWLKLKSRGLPPTGILMALAILSACLNAPTFLLFSFAKSTPLTTAIAGFISSTIIMVLATHLFFGKFRSVLPASFLFTTLSALLKVTGLA